MSRLRRAVASTWLLITFLVIALLLVWVDIRGGHILQFLRAHSLVAALLVNTISLSVAGLLLERYWGRRQAAQWQLILRTATRETGYQATLVAEGMDHLLTGMYAYKVREIIGPTLDDHLIRVLKQDPDYYEPNRRDPPEDRRARITELLKRPEWPNLAYRILDSLKHDFCTHVATWMPILLASDTLRGRGNVLGAFNEELEQLQIKLADVAYHPGEGAELSTQRKLLIDAWLEADCVATETHVRQMRVLDPEWRHLGRERHLEDHCKKQLTKRIAEDPDVGQLLDRGCRTL